MPTPDQIREAIALVSKRGANLAYFFQKLDSPEWIRPLWEAGFFSNPTPAERLDDSIRFPIWHESRYLVRMAGREPQLVRGVLLGVPASDNERVHEDILEAAAQMPPTLAKDIAERETQWIATQPWIHMLIPEKARRLVRHLARGGEVQAAFSLWRELLSLRDQAGEPLGRLRPWDYAEVLRLTVPDLAQADAIGTISILRDLLAIAVDKRTDEGDDKGDYSVIWRPAIDQSDDRQVHDKIEDALVTATRDAARQAMDKDTLRLPEVIDIFIAGESSIFSRLALNLLSEFPAAVPGLLDRFLCDPESFDNWLVQHEYVLLLRSAFGLASTECQQSILAWIDVGPDHERISRRLGTEPTSDEEEDLKRRWQRDRLAPVAKYLEGKWLERYRQLVEEFGEPPDPEFLAFKWVSGWEPERPPMTLEQLGQMSTEELVEYLKTWEPPDGPMRASEEGLAGVLRALATDDGARLSASSESFIGLQPVYVRELLTGLGAYLEKGPIDWSRTLSLAQWVAAQRGAERSQPEDHSKDNWVRWAADAALELIRDGMSKPNSGLKIEQRDTVWQVISDLLDDPEPTPDHEKDSLDSNWDALTLSLNTTRGKAMHASMVYTIWVVRSVSDQPAVGHEGRLASLMPEAAQALERHLDRNHDPSLAIRSVYGRRFDWLVAIDTEWSSRNAPVVFPRDPDLQAYWDAAWSSYLTIDTLNRNVFHLLDNEYRHAITLLGSDRGARGTRFDPEDALAQHMMLLYLHGDLELEDGSLLFDFYQRAPDSIRGHGLDFIGRISGGDGFNEEMRSRAMLLWGARLDNARTDPEKHKDEIRAFGWWTMSQAFDRKWTLDNLESALELGVGVEVEHKAAEFLAATAQEWPTKAVRCLRYLIKADKEGWGIYAWRESARSILSFGLDDGDSQELTKQVVGELLALGHFDYRDVLPDHAP